MTPRNPLSTKIRSAIGWMLCLSWIGLATAAPPPASLQLAVAPGTAVVNTVAVQYTQGGSTATRTAAHTFLVDRLVDVVVSWQDGSPVHVAAGSSQQSLLFKVTNTGNGSDGYGLALSMLPGTGQDFTAVQCKLFLDRDNNGVYSSGDAPYVPSSNDPVLAAGASIGVLALCDIPGAAIEGRFASVRLTATSTTLSGDPGSAKPDPHIPGVSAVVGLTGGQSAATGTYQAQNADYLLTSTQAVADQDGVSVPRSGSRITYTLIVTPNGGKAIGRNLVVRDAMPNFTTYVPGSLTLNQASISDASDGDAGDFGASTPNSISVRLGDVAGNATPPFVITFQVTIN